MPDLNKLSARVTEAIDFYLRGSALSDEDQSIRATHLLYADIYFGWKTLNNEYGEDDGRELYRQCWAQLLANSFKAVMQKMGIEKIADLPTLGLVYQAYYHDTGGTCAIVESTPERVVCRIDWCPKPAMGPADTHTERLRYYHTECLVTQWVHERLVELAGMAGRVSTIQDTFMCYRGEDKFCRVIFAAKRV